MLVDKKRYLLREEEDALAEKYCSECQKPFCAFCDTEVEDADIEQPQWIPCSERLPEEDEDVLLQFSSNMGVGFYRDGWAVNTGEGIYSVVDYSEEKPIAWMPLPKPYGGERE